MEGEDREKTECHIEKNISGGGVNGAELHSSSSLNLPLCLILCMQRMELERQKRERVEESMRRRNNAKCKAETQHS